MRAAHLHRQFNFLPAGTSRGTMGRARIIFMAFLACLWIASPLRGAAQNFNLTAAVLVNSSNTTGFNTNPATPGEYQQHAERYLEHLQIPFDVLDVSKTNPPADFNSRQLIVAAHSGLALPAVWQNAIVTAVNGGTGFVNLDSQPAASNAQHLLTLFGATGFGTGTASTAITVPFALSQAGATPHYIDGLQWKSPLELPGDFVYSFHPDQSGNLNTATATLLLNAVGTVVAKLGTDPLITASTHGAGRVVNFGTMNYLQADRFGFMMGVDDLFWRSLVWSARKPFAVRGYPRLWALRMDHNVDTNWWTRVNEMYDPALTGNTVADGTAWGTGGPWKVTSSAYLNFLPSGDPGRAAIIQDMNAGKIQLTPHGFQSETDGDLFWAGTDTPPGPLTDTEEQSSINSILDWQGRLPSDPIADPLPANGLSNWVLGHFYDMSNNLGPDLWNIGFRYLGTTDMPGNVYTTDPTQAGYQAERLKVRPFWLYQLPPKPTGVFASDESFSFFFADDITIGGRSTPAPQSPQKFFLIGSRALNQSLAGGDPDVGWCDGTGDGMGFAVGKFEWYTWRLYSSMAPVELFTHDDAFSNCVTSPVTTAFPAPPANVALRGGAQPNASMQIIQGVSSWLNTHGTHQVFMQDMAQYIFARTKSTLTQASFDGSQIHYTFTGQAADADGRLVPTQVLVFAGDTEGQWQSVAGFSNGLTTTIAPPPAPPTVVAVNPAFGPIPGGTTITISGAGFTLSSAVTVGGAAATGVTFVNSSTLTAVTPAGTRGSADVTVVTPNGSGTLSAAFTFLGAPAITRISPTSGPSTAGNIINVFGSSFTPNTQIAMGGTPIANLTFVSTTLMTGTIPANAIGANVAVTATNPNGTGSLATPYSYLDPATILLQDSFNGDSNVTWNASPLGLANSFSIVNNTKDNSGIGPTQQFAGSPNWLNYTFETKVQLFSLQNFPGGIRGRVNTTTGVAYAVWLYPGTNLMRLFRTTGWSIDSPGLVTLAAATVNYDTTNFHTLRLSFQGPQIQVSWDGTTVLSATDSTNPTGEVALDVSNQHIEFEDALVTGTASNTPFVSSLSLTPATFTLTTGAATQQLTLTATMSDGSTQNLTNSAGAAYSSSNTAVATVSATGLVAAVASGTATITATNSGISATAVATVNIPVSPSITRVSPTRGSTAGGDRMDILGRNLGATTVVQIQGHTATVISAASDGSRMTVTVPAGTAGAGDITVTNPNGTSFTLSGGYTYVNPAGILFQDAFNSASLSNWTPSPLGLFTNWTAAQDVADYNGGGHTQIFAGSPSWTDYTVEAKFIVPSNSNFPGGLRGRVNTATGAAYEAWLVPTSNTIILFRTTAWNIDTPGLTNLGQATVAFNPAAFTSLKLSFQGTQISVIYNGTTVIQATDATLTSGAIALDVSNQHIQFDDVFVTTP